jgi:hypothetical protein
MSSVNFYNRGSQNGIGIQTLWAGIMVHVIAWEDGSLDRLPVDDHSSSNLTVSFIGPMKDLIAEVNSVKPPLPPVEPPAPPTPDVPPTPPAPPAPPSPPAPPIPDANNTTNDVNVLPPWNSWVPEGESEAAKVRAFLTAFPIQDNAEVIKALKSKGVEVSSSQVNAARKALAS